MATSSRGRQSTPVPESSRLRADWGGRVPRSSGPEAAQMCGPPGVLTTPRRPRMAAVGGIRPVPDEWGRDAQDAPSGGPLAASGRRPSRHSALHGDRCAVGPRAPNCPTMSSTVPSSARPLATTTAGSRGCGSCSILDSTAIGVAKPTGHVGQADYAGLRGTQGDDGPDPGVAQEAA